MVLSSFISHCAEPGEQTDADAQTIVKDFFAIFCKAILYYRVSSWKSWTKNYCFMYCLFHKFAHTHA